MSHSRTIEVALPDCLEMSADDLNVLSTTLQTIITLMSGGCDGAEAHLQRMHDQRWTVEWGLTWIARARRDGSYEEATGPTKQETLARLGRLTSLHEVEGCP
ncbi:MAG: hypothetical protein RBT60_12970 [Candidatus Krumholzibacteria bacterium]|jgi:hypothetical protein|nr:hypothetical protein [Candidatus Krumholzibacteria bacterium]